MRKACLVIILWVCILFSSAIAEIDSSYIVFDVSRYGEVRYQYFVIDINGDVLFDGYEADNPPKARMVKSTILELTYPEGNVSYCRYFDLANGRISLYYGQVITAADEYVLYTDYIDSEWKIVVADLFTAKPLQCIPVDLGSATGVVESCIWSDDNTECTIVYMSTDGYAFKKIVVPIGVCYQ